MGLQLIRVGQLNEVSQLLSQPEYAPLRPVLLLLGWDVFVAEGSGKELTEALWPSQARTETLILHLSSYMYSVHVYMYFSKLLRLV